MREGRVAYVLKGYPRRSELFIASEVYRLEQREAGPLLFVLTPPEETDAHPVVARIAAVPEHLPATTSLSGRTLPGWLHENAGPFLPAVRRTALRHPVRLARAAGAAAAQSVRARSGWRPRSLYAKELLLAVELADRVRRAGDVTHLHAHFAHGATTVTWLAAMLTGLPFSFTGHAKDIYRPSLNPAGLLARKLRAAAFAVTCTGANVDHLLALEPTARVHLVYHGLNADMTDLLGVLPAGRPADPSAGAPFRLVSVGRLVPKKGFDVLLAAVSVLVDQGVDVRLDLVGEDGEASDRVRELLDTLGLRARVRMPGALGQAELLALYRRSAAFALACRVDGDGDRDGIPNVLVEAMAAGLPVVSTRVSGIPELVRDGRDGLLVDPDDPVALAAALCRLADDPLLRERLGREGIRTVRARFDGDVMAGRLVRLMTSGSAS